MVWWHSRETVKSMCLLVAPCLSLRTCLKSYGTDLGSVWYWVVLIRFVPLQLRLKSEKNSENCTWNTTRESARYSSETMHRSPKCLQQEFYKCRISSARYRKSVFQTIEQKWANAPEFLRCAYFIYRVSNSSFLRSGPVVSYVKVKQSHYRLGVAQRVPGG